MINKLCPFCGSEPEKDEWGVHCTTPKCPLAMEFGLEEYYVLFDAAAWNTRPIEDKLTARIAELEAEVKELKSEYHPPEIRPEEEGWYLAEIDDYGELEEVPMYWFVGWNEADYTHYYGKIKRWRKLPKS